MIARSLRLWPVSTSLTESMCRVLSLTDKEALFVQETDMSRKPPYELALRLGRTFPESVAGIIRGISLCESESETSSLRHKELILSQVLDAALSPFCVLGASNSARRAAHSGKEIVTAEKLDLLASDAWTPYLETLSSYLSLLLALCLLLVGTILWSC